MKFLTSLVLAISGLAFSALAEPVNEACPISGKPAKSGQTVEQTVVLGFCCGNCQSKFEASADAEKFAEAKLAAAGEAVNQNCPVSGKPIDADVVAMGDGKTVGFCCAKCQAKFSEDPTAFADKVKTDRPANDKCPMSGKPVKAETATAAQAEIGFCCGNCKGKFEKDPTVVN